MTRSSRGLIASAALALLLLAGCFDPDYGVGGAEGAVCNELPRRCPEGYVCVPVTAEVNKCWRAESAPAATIAVKLDRSTVRYRSSGAKETLVVSVTLGNFAVDKDAVGSHELEPHFGHYHIYLDDPSNFSPSAANYVSGKETTVSLVVDPEQPPFRGAKAGNHTLFVSLANHNHTELVPVARAEAAFAILPPSTP